MISFSKNRIFRFFGFSVLFLSLGLGGLGCAEAVVNTDPANGVKYSDHGAQAEVRGDVAQISQISQRVLEMYGYQVAGAQSQDAAKSQDLEGRAGIDAAAVHIRSEESGKAHVEVVATVGKLCSNMDFAGQILQDIVLSKTSL